MPSLSPYLVIMKLTEAEYTYIENEASTKSRAILDKFYEEVDSLVASFVEAYGGSRYQVYVRRIKECAKETIESRVTIYVELCRKLGKFPDSEDVQKFVSSSKPYVLSKLKLFSDYRNNPFGEAINESVADAIEKTLAADLEYKIFPIGLQPLNSFFLEGKVEEERRQRKFETSDRLDMEKSLVDQLLTPTDRLWLEALYEHQKKEEKISDRALEIELSDSLPRDFTHHSIRGAFLRREGITILGIALLDPENELVRDADEIIIAIRGILKGDADRKIISAEQISKITGLGVKRVEHILEDIGHFKGLFHHSGVSAGITGWSAININEEGTFKDYRKYENLHQVLEDLALVAKSDKSSTALQNPSLGPEVAVAGSTIHVGGDYVGGNQIKTGDVHSGAQNIRFATDSASPVENSGVTDRSRPWYDNTILVIAIVGVLVAIVGVLVAIYFPEVRSWLGLRVQGN